MPNLNDLLKCTEQMSMRGGGEGMSPIIARWMLNLLLARSGRLQRALDRNPQVMVDFCAEFGLGWKEKEQPAVEELRSRLGRHLARLCSFNVSLGGPFARNIDLLGDQLDLSPVERDIIAFTALIQIDGRAAGVIDALYPRATEYHAMEAMTLALEAPRREAAHALSPDNRLRRAGLVRLTGDVDDSLSHRLNLARGLVNRLTDAEVSMESLLAEHFHPEIHSNLDWEDFAHLGRDREILSDYLARALEQTGVAGANVLLAGAPGTGKTELCRVIARELNARIWAIGNGHRRARFLDVGERTEALFMAQEILAGSSRALIVFDEIEDLFGLDLNLFQSHKTEHTKAWMNERLESNRVPTLWITNSTRRIDPAHLRRFDLVLEMPPASRRLKTRLLERKLPAGLAETRLGQKLIGDTRITPADLDTLARVAGTVQADNDHHTLAADLERVIDNRFRVIRGTGYRTRPTESEAYDLQWLNTNTDIDAITRAIERSQRGRILLHGPPGTGKTGFTRFLAERIDRPLFRKPASELLSPFLGESEQLIESAFREAEREQGILMLDEADSLLASRTNARQQWQVSITNEILQAMEDFDGIFVAASNLADRLDHAAMRRFDWRVELDWLRRDQVVALADATLNEHGQDALTAEHRGRLNRLGPVSPGDYRIAIRRAEIEGMPLAAELLVATLEEEAADREPVNCGVGFIASLK